ncbi:hypothetical protein [Vibrio owensii]|uniref:hypothetical protein n=1 Tax=Vibrio owensii TaxID=696485 RepID=UPI003CC5793B
MKDLVDVKQHELRSIVHPEAIARYCRKLGIRNNFELSSGMQVLIVDELPQSDCILEPSGELKQNMPFTFRVSLHSKATQIDDIYTKTARYQHKEPEPPTSIFDQIPPLSASVVEYEKHLSKPKETGFSLAWMQVQSTMSQDQIWSELFTSETPKEAKEFIKLSNSHLNEPVLQGEIVVIPSMRPGSASEQNKLNQLTEEAKAASLELAKLTEEELTTANRHFELLDYYADEAFKALGKDGLPSDLYAYGSMGVGAIATGVEQHLKNINGILLEINQLYVSHVAMASRTGGVNYGPFISERAELFKKLDGSFSFLSKRSIKIPVFKQIKRNLKLSTRSIIHNADEIIAKGVVPNLGKRMANVAIGIATSRGVGYVGLILGAASGAKNVYDACSVDVNGECGRVTTREIGGFIGGWYVGAQTGQLAATGTLLVLGVVGITSAPIIAIAAVGAFVVGGSIGGIIGATAGKAIGDIVYEKAVELIEASEEIIEDLL